jgi:hypothetical protein
VTPSTSLEAGCACLPAENLAHLAPLRARPGLRVLLRGGLAWVFWPEGDEEVTRQVLPVAGAEVLCRRDGYWHRPGEHLPTFSIPDAEEARPLAAVLTPAPVVPEACSGHPLTPLPLTLVRDSEAARPATALRCPVPVLLPWAESATSAQLGALEAAHCEGEVLLRGSRLPPLTGAERFWGGRVLIPLGFRPEPAFPEAVLAEVLQLWADELAVLGPAGAEVIPGSAFGPVTRAGVRLLARGAAP